MSLDFDTRLAATLDAHAGPEIDAAPIVARARSRGRRLRRWRRGLTAASAAAVCGALIGAVVAIPEQQPPGPPRLPLPAAGHPGAAERPDLVGADPAVLHFTADDLLAGAERATWSAGEGTESVEVRGASRHARFVLARDAATLNAVRQSLASSGRPTSPTDVRVNGRPGTAWSDPSPSGGQHLWFVRWQPVDGLWAQLDIYAAGRDEATSAASLVRFDGARRCAVPFRLRLLPEDARLLRCTVSLAVNRSDAFTEGLLVAGDDAGRRMTVRAQRAASEAGGMAELNAGPYRVRRQGDAVLQMSVQQYVVELFLQGWGAGYSEQDGLTVLSGYEPIGDVDDPATW